jgi:cysteine desulfurase/selenocysteine lyase
MDQATSSSTYNVNRIRADFPILAMQVYGKPLVYLDNAASAQKPRVVLDRLNEVHHAICQCASRAAFSCQ